ncbi:MAG TPA: glycosyltransferase family 4 protein, partial [Chthoniobacterales bacterium]|nr:glycosyltransferase family 4 protein [Chthoniobacterales bacterium]
MKIAIVAPCPVPYTIGGAEKMWWGLHREINRNTSHQAEIVKLPTKEHSFWDLVESYEAFSKLDLSGFDLVISGKYPAWMISHPRHICYMQHRLRGLYDHYHFNKLPDRYTTESHELLVLQRLLDEPPSRDRLEEVFSMLRSLRYRSELPADAFQFPGSVIKQIVEYLDGVGLHRDAIENYYAISKTVANRASYYPRGAAVEVIYPPSNLDRFHCGAFDYIFTASRIDGAKRIALLAEAMQFVNADIDLRIAGEGPDRPRIEELARRDPRIKLLGFRSDAELIDDYANARAVAFLPFEEDYGLITIEAMMSGKPVLTTTDSGGPTEFVRNRETGICVAPDPAELGTAIQWLATHKDDAQRMGRRARDQVRPITWKNAVARLLSGRSVQPSRARQTSKRRKLTVATTFGVTPVRGGGQARIFHLYKNMAPVFETELITLGNFGEKPFVAEIAPGVREIRIPKSPEHTEAENNIAAQVEWFSITDVVFPELFHLTPEYVEALERSARDAEAVVTSHPYPLAAIESITDKPVWYEAQDVEYMLKGAVVPKTPRGLRIIEEVREIEQRCCEKAGLIMTCSEADRDHFIELYNADAGKMHIVPNGVDSTETPFVPRARARELKQDLGLSEEFLTLFVGSWHQPNLDAIEVILSLAEQQPAVRFLVLGSSCAAFAGRQKPTNVGFFGVVDDETKALVISAADLALNPMRNGSGTNLKMLDYAAAGVPILSS